MNTKDFNDLLERRIELTRKVLASKSAEYSTDDDKLFNFKETARRMNCNPEDVAHWFMQKHVTSVEDIIKGKKVTREVIDEKIGDIINYYILLESIFVEKLC